MVIVKRWLFYENVLQEGGNISERSNLIIWIQSKDIKPYKHSHKYII